MRVLVTGGAGFLGSHLCDRLIAGGHEVICLDNFYTGRRSNVAHLLGNSNFEIVRHDVTLPIHMEMDRIFNLACPASPIHYQFDPVQTIKTCVLGAINALDLARRTHTPILQASTSEVYGNPEVHPQPESYWGSVNPNGIRSCYDEGKRCAETLFFDYHRQHQVEIKVARIFNTYGPRMREDDGRVISNLIVQALRNDPITVYGDGQHTRSFCYVDDLIEGLLRLMDSPADCTGPINIGNTEEYSINDLARLIVDMTNSRSEITYMPLPMDDPRQRLPDLALAREELGWSPAIPLAKGLSHTIAYFETLLSGKTQAAG
jgi:UDP-glucuronate decarboxylase